MMQLERGQPVPLSSNHSRCSTTFRVGCHAYSSPVVECLTADEGINKPRPSTSNAENSANTETEMTCRTGALLLINRLCDN